MITRYPILTLRLLNEPLSHHAGSRIDRLVKAKDLLRQYPQACQEEGVNIELFHDEAIRYSGIQVDQYQGATEWTAIGLPSVKALVLWYQLAQSKQLINCHHVIESTEFYSPCFLDHPKRYRIPNWILSKNIQQALQRQSHYTQQKTRLEKYLYGNLMTFFNHLGFRFDKQHYFLEVKINHFKALGQSLPIFRQRQKAAYQVDFSVNFQLPQSLRLGQSTALGYGKVETIYWENTAINKSQKHIKKINK